MVERPYPIDVDEDERSGDEQTLGGDSPTKRAKTSMIAATSGIDQRQLVSLIQSTIQESVQSSVQSSLSPLQSAVQSLSDKSVVQDSRLDKVEQHLESQQAVLANMDLQHARRMDSLKDELTQLQQVVVSSPASSGSPVSASGPTMATFDIVLGGWKDGATRDWVEHEIAKLLDCAEVRLHVSETLVFGKRPAFAKLKLNLEAHWAPAERRAFQLKVLTKLRSAQWAPGGCEAWVTTDKTPGQRKVSKAIAQLNAFLRDRLKVDRGSLDVASWAAAKAFIGEFRVTGLSEEHDLGAKPRCAVADLRWLVRDARSGTNVWLDLHALSQGLGMNKPELHKQWLAHFGGTSS